MNQELVFWPGLYKFKFRAWTYSVETTEIIFNDLIEKLNNKWTGKRISDYLFDIHQRNGNDFSWAEVTHCTLFGRTLYQTTWDMKLRDPPVLYSVNTNIGPGSHSETPTKKK